LHGLVPHSPHHVAELLYRALASYASIGRVRCICHLHCKTRDLLITDSCPDSNKEIGVYASHYLFPACETGHFDPTKPQKSWRTAWRNLTRLIPCPACGTEQNPGKACINEECKADISKVRSSLHGLRFHDLRHHAIAELAEGQTSDGVIMGIAGHVSRAMLEHYSHVRIEAKRPALDSWAMGKSGGYDTNKAEREDQIPQVIEKMVSAAGFEPATHALKGHCSTN